MTTTSAAPCPLHPWIAQPCNICTTTFSVPPAQGEPQPEDDFVIPCAIDGCKQPSQMPASEYCSLHSAIGTSPTGGEFAPQPAAAPAQGEPRNLTRDEQQMLGRALRASAREVTEYREPPTLADAIAAGDGTLHGAIDYWHSRAIRAEAERDALQADAERYRWLRAAQSQTARNWIVINNRNMYGEHELDAAIDAGRKP